MNGTKLALVSVVLAAAVILWASPAEAQQLNPPTDFSGTATGTDTIQWSWTDTNTSPNETAHKVYDTGDNTEKASAGPGSTSVDETGLSENIQYDRYVKAIGSAGGGATIGTGTDTGMHPLDSWYNYNACQMLYTKAEINSGGGGAGNITKIRFKKADTTSWTFHNIKIYLKHTTLANLEGDFWTTPEGTLVYSGDLVVTSATGWYEIVLTTSFAYNNSNNLLVTVTNETGDAGSPIDWYCTDTGFWDPRMCAEDEDGSSLANCISGIGDTRYRPNIQLVYTGIVIPDSDPSNSDTKYTLAHNPLDSDFTVATLGNGQVRIDVVPPPNSTGDFTGVKIERDEDGDFLGGDYAVVQGFAAVYSNIIDTVPAGGIYYYRIIYQNGDEVPTTPSNAKTIDVPGELGAPLNFGGTGTALDQIEWAWNPARNGYARRVPARRCEQHCNRADKGNHLP
jgi:hypothetical protein